MRKFVVSLMLLTLLFTAHAFAADSGALTGFGLHRTYEAGNDSGPYAEVQIDSSSQADYSNITKYWQNMNYPVMTLAGLVSKNYSGSLPSGTLTVLDGGKEGIIYTLSPTGYYGNNLVNYQIYYNDGNDNMSLQALTESKIRWNIPDSDRSIPGILEVPSEDDFNNYEQTKELGEIVPYVAVVNSGNKYTVKVYFIEAGDDKYKPVNPGSDVSYLSINGFLYGSSSVIIDKEFTDIASLSNDVVDTGTANISYGSFTVTYNKGSTTYNWRFWYNSSGGNSDYWIDFNDLNNRPFTMSLNDPAEIYITMSGKYTLEEAKKLAISIGNGEIITASEITCARTNKEDEESDIECTFTLTPKKAGRTILSINNITNQNYTSQQFAINVEDEEGEIPGQDSSIKPTLISRHNARIANGSPIYDSAEFTVLILQITAIV